MLSDEIAVELLDLWHQVGIKPDDLDSRLTKPELSTTTYPVIGIEGADGHSSNPSFYDPLDTCDLGMISGRAWLQGRKECGTRQRCVGKLPFEKCELCMLSWAEFPTIGFPEHFTIARYDRADLRGNSTRLALATAC